MNEKPVKSQTQDPLDLPPSLPRFPESEKFTEGIYARNMQAKFRKENLVDLLNNKDFQEDLFRKSVDSWNENEGKTKGFSGQYSQIEGIRCSHGKLKVYYFLGSDAVKFGFELS